MKLERLLELAGIKPKEGKGKDAGTKGYKEPKADHAQKTGGDAVKEPKEGKGKNAGTKGYKEPKADHKVKSGGKEEKAPEGESKVPSTGIYKDHNVTESYTGDKERMLHFAGISKEQE